MMRLKYIIALLAVALTSCNKIVENKNIPYAVVSFDIDVSTSDSELREDLTGNSKVYTKDQPAAQSAGWGSYGYSGVVVVRAIDNKLYAFDICCPYEANRAIALLQNGYFMECPVCGSQFSIGNGSGYVNKGPAVEPLKTYHVYGFGLDKYRVTN